VLWLCRCRDWLWLCRCWDWSLLPWVVVLVEVPWGVFVLVAFGAFAGVMPARLAFGVVGPEGLVAHPSTWPGADIVRRSGEAPRWGPATGGIQEARPCQPHTSCATFPKTHN
jgi:hypothetical protein